MQMFQLCICYINIKNCYPFTKISFGTYQFSTCENSAIIFSQLNCKTNDKQVATGNQVYEGQQHM